MLKKFNYEKNRYAKIAHLLFGGLALDFGSSSTFYYAQKRIQLPESSDRVAAGRTGWAVCQFAWTPLVIWFFFLTQVCQNRISSETRVLNIMTI